MHDIVFDRRKIIFLGTPNTIPIYYTLQISLRLLWIVITSPFILRNNNALAKTNLRSSPFLDGRPRRVSQSFREYRLIVPVKITLCSSFTVRYSVNCARVIIVAALHLIPTSRYTCSDAFNITNALYDDDDNA